jgi:hypothetical protein
MSLARIDLAVSHLCNIVDQLGTGFPPPRLVRHGEVTVERHEAREQTNGLACYLKVVKICSTLNGAIALIARGFAQEAYALCRIVDEQVEDVHFLLPPRGENETLSDRQLAVLDEFYQEEFEDPSDPIGSAQPRDRVPRKKIQAAISSSAGVSDPSTAQAIARTLQSVVSGYVHGAYVHIMELHGETPGRYRMRGAYGRVSEAVEFVPNYVFRAMLAIEHLVKVSARADLLPQITALSAAFGTEFNLLPPAGAELLAARAARHRSTPGS